MISINKFAGFRESYQCLSDFLEFRISPSAFEEDITGQVEGARVASFWQALFQFWMEVILDGEEWEG